MRVKFIFTQLEEENTEFSYNTLRFPASGFIQVTVREKNSLPIHSTLRMKAAGFSESG
jgi:hypothetical protein